MDKGILIDFYARRKMSAHQIARTCGTSESKVNYWLKKYNISKRGIAEAIYVRSNPAGDPFSVPHISTKSLEFVYGLGLGLFWGEGNKRDLHSVRLGNSDVRLVRSFVHFLRSIYQIDTSKLRFGVQIFHDSNPEDCMKYWMRELSLPRAHFYKPIVSSVRGQGTYKNKSRYGVITIYFNNTKLRDHIVGAIENLHYT